MSSFFNTRSKSTLDHIADVLGLLLALAEGQDDGADQGSGVPEGAGGAGVGAGGEEAQAGEAHPGPGGSSGAAAEQESQGADQQVGGRGEPDGNGDGGVRRGGAGAPCPGVPPLDGADQRAVRRRRHLLPQGAAQGHRQHQAQDHGKRLLPIIDSCSFTVRSFPVTAILFLQRANELTWSLSWQDGCDWNEASFREAMTKAVNDATSSPPTTTTTSLPPCARVPLVVTA